MDNLSEEEKKAIDEFKKELRLAKNIDDITTRIRNEYAEIIVEVIDKQQKEIEVLREENFDTIYMKAVADYKSKIREILQIEGNADIETYLKTIVAENNRLEDIEDDRDCNYVSKDKIRDLLKQVNASLYHFKDREKNNIMQRIKDRLEELLEE